MSTPRERRFLQCPVSTTQECQAKQQSRSTSRAKHVDLESSCEKRLPPLPAFYLLALCRFFLPSCCKKSPLSSHPLLPPPYETDKNMVSDVILTMMGCVRLPGYVWGREGGDWCAASRVDRPSLWCGSAVASRASAIGLSVASKHVGLPFLLPSSLVSPIEFSMGKYFCPSMSKHFL